MRTSHRQAILYLKWVKAYLECLADKREHSMLKVEYTGQRRLKWEK